VLFRSITALVCSPDMEGIDIFQKNRSKCGIRGTWQARIRFNDVKVPKSNLLHKEGQGLKVALTCLNYGRCTLSAGMLGGARRAMDQSIKWSRTRHQFSRPLADFDLVKQHVAMQSALTYAMDAMLYMTTGFLDRHDDDIMVETAICKTFCSEMGWRSVNSAIQIMGGESYMTENEIERIFRDSRINLIVEGANEVMQSFIFAYGGKALAEQMIGVQDRIAWDSDQSLFENLGRITPNLFNSTVMAKAAPLAAEIFFGMKKAAPRITKLHPSLAARAELIGELVREHSYQFKIASKVNEEKIIDRQVVQARIADTAIYLHGMICVLSKLDMQIRSGEEGPEFERDRTAAFYFLDLAHLWIRENWRALKANADTSMRTASEAAIALNDTMPNDRFSIPESSPTAKGTGRTLNQNGIKQFPGESQKHQHS